MTAPGGESIGVTAAHLTSHADAVDDVADQMRQGRSAAGQVRLGREAYGQLCQLIPALLDPIQESAVDALAASVDALEEMAEALRSTATGYRGTDTAAEQRLRGAYRP
jgi:hypothetical protein